MVRRRTAHWLGWLALGACLGTPSCETEYTAPPTACDFWCDATLRANCEEDDPVICVVSCEQSLLLQRGKCATDVERLRSCFATSDDRDFHCAHDVTTPNSGVCLAEQLDVLACSVPEGVPCFDACESRAASCPAFPQESCNSFCLLLVNDCLDEARAFFSCLGAPKSCDTSLASYVPTECDGPLERWADCRGITLGDPTAGGAGGSGGAGM